MKRFKGTKGIICLAVICVLIVGYYYYLSNREPENVPEDEVVVTEIQNVLLRDLKHNYPPSPKEVVKCFLEITKHIYNGKGSEEEFEALALKIQEIYDDDLIANKSPELYMQDLKSEAIIFKENDYSIVNYATSSSVDVDYFNEDGFSFARLRGTLYIRVGTEMKSLEQIFLLRQDADGHWKIYGWQEVEQEVEKEAEEMKSE